MSNCGASEMDCCVTHEARALGRAARDGGGGIVGGLPAESMLEHPVYVHWCVSCGLEAPEDARLCPRCRGAVRRHQRVEELPDEDPGPLSLASLRAALADVTVGEDVGGSAVLLSEQGPDPGLAKAHPALAAELAALGVPPAVQRALVNRGFETLEQITAAATSAPREDAVSVHLGLSPAAEVLLRRLWHVAVERRSSALRAAQRRRPAAAPLAAPPVSRLPRSGRGFSACASATGAGGASLRGRGDGGEEVGVERRPATDWGHAASKRLCAPFSGGGPPAFASDDEEEMSDSRLLAAAVRAARCCAGPQSDAPMQADEET